MLITRNFIFVHLPKTGGDFVRGVLQRHLPPDDIIHTEIKKHGSLDDAPSDARDLPVFASVRNPWDWHVSWYHYLAGVGRPDVHRERVRQMNPLFVRLSRDFQDDCCETLTRLYRWARLDHPEASAGMLHDLAEQDIDIQTWHLQRQLGSGTDKAFIGRQESLREDLYAFLQSIDYPVSSEFEKDLKTSPPVNKSSHQSRERYFDDALREEIQRRARGIIDRFDYEY